LSLWAVFIAVLLAAGAYRNRRLWYALMPALLIHLTWLLIKTTFGFSPSAGQMIAQIFVPFYIGAGILFVLAHRVGGQNRFGLFLLAAAILAGGGVLSFFAYNFGGTEISKLTMMAFIFYGILSAAFLLALAMATFLCRERYSRLRFAAWLLVWVFLFTMIFVFVYGFYDYRPSDFNRVLEVLTAGAAFGLGLCGIVLPFMILAFASSFYRRILHSLLRLPSTLQEPASSITEQK